MAAGACLGASVVLFSPPAQADAVTLGSAADYVILEGNGANGGHKEKLTLGANRQTTKITGANADIGLGSNDAGAFAGTLSISGSLTKGAGDSISGGTGGFSGGVLTTSSAQSAVAQALSDAASGQGQATAEGLTGGGAAYLDTAYQSGISTSTTLKALSSGDNVFVVSYLSLSSGTLTLDANGIADANFVIDITGSKGGYGLNLSSSSIALSGGAAAADILFNVEGAGATVNITGTSSHQSTAYGTILAPAANVTVSNATLTGAIIAGLNNLGTSYTTKVQNATIDFQHYSPPHRTPEPNSMSLLVGALTALFAIRRRLRRSGA